MLRLKNNSGCRGKKKHARVNRGELINISSNISRQDDKMFPMCYLDKSGVEISIFDDCSTDDTSSVIESCVPSLVRCGYEVKFSRSDGTTGKGAGFARNQAIKQSTGRYLLCQDADDLMHPRRLELQLAAMQEKERLDSHVIVGCQFNRFPADATPRYVQWANSLSPKQLRLQAFRELTLIQPTWMFSRELWNKLGGYDDTPGCPEDMIFWFKHLAAGGRLHRVDEVLVVYRYHEGETSRRIHRLTLMTLKVEAFQSMVLSKWKTFSIWGAGRDGRKFYMQLSPENQCKVTAFYDVDAKKIGTDYMNCWTLQKIPIRHFSELTLPVVICVGLENRGTDFEANMRTAGLTPEREGEFMFFI